jgi:hypothetical protein
MNNWLQSINGVQKDLTAKFMLYENTKTPIQFLKK